MRSRFDILRGSLRLSRAELRSSRPRPLRLCARSSFELRSSRPRRLSAARSRFDARTSPRADALSRPRFADDLEAVALAADFFEALEAACADGRVNKKIVEATSVSRRGKTNFGVIELFLA
jgi:hypothetical protein